MPSLALADAQDLVRWAATRRAQELLPALVRRLVHATTTTATHVGLASGEAVQLGGYDGVVVTDEDHHAVPRGASAWEMGTNQDVATKATGDYAKRTAAPPVSDVGAITPAETTFVFVTPRRWPGKAAWAEARRAEGVWRDVRVLDADDLEGWLEQAPAVHVWLSELIGKRPRGADDLEAVWRDWAEATAPALSPALTFAGREPTRDALLAWWRCDDGRPTLGVEAESPEEAVALAAAALQALPDGERVALLARTVLVRDADAFTYLAATDAALTIVAAFPAGDLAQRAVRQGHRVLLALAPGTGVTATLTVPRPHREAAAQALEAMGLPHDRARELGGLARRSMLALRRRLATSASVIRPAWAAPEAGPSLIPMLLFGGFNEGAAGDREALAALAGEPYDTVLAHLVRWAGEADPPVRRVGGVWYLVSKADAWEALHRFLTRDILERFATVALAVLGAPDPAFELPPDQRWAAGLYKKERRHSGLLAENVADTLALLGARGDAVHLGGGATAATTAARVVRDLFEGANRDWTRWAAFAHALPLLAEAAPDEVLAALDAGLAGDDAPVMGLFGHDTGQWAAGPRHTELLWALERMAWSPDLLGRAALVLAELARRDPGGKYANRPGASLRTIFLPWLPQTAAPLDARLAVLDTLRQRESAAAWTLMVGLLPTLHDHSMPTATPEWREWAPDAPQRVTNLVLERHANEMGRRLLEDAGTDGARWAALVEALDDVPAAAYDAILAGLDRLAGAPLPAAARSRVWGALREFLSRHRSLPEAEWALPAEHLAAIDSVFRRFEPEDVVDRHAWLFSDRPALPDGREHDWEAHHRLLEERRVEAARALHAALTPPELITLSTTLRQPGVLGAALAGSGAVVSDADAAALAGEALADERLGARAFGRGFLSALVHRRGREALTTVMTTHGAGWSDVVRAEALLALPAGPATWADVELLSPEGRARYWQQTPTFWVDAADVERAVTELVQHDRPHAAVELAASHVMRTRRATKNGSAPEGPATDGSGVGDSDPVEAPAVSGATIAAALLAAVQVAGDPNGARSSGYELRTLFDALDRETARGEIDDEKVAQLELLYLPALSRERAPTVLHRQLARDPALFVEAVCLAYREEGQPARTLSESEALSARLAYELLHGWRALPGDPAPGGDGEPLADWVRGARERLAQANRQPVGDVLIGQVLSGSPAGEDGAWPAEAVRDVIEELRSEAFERGLWTGKFNQRGVVSKHPLAGGALEREIVARYEADAAAVATRWPRTAAMLRAFAARYRDDARREDDEAELRHDLDL